MTQRSDSCDSDPFGVTPMLYLPAGPAGPGFLVWPMEDDRGRKDTLVVELSSAFVRLTLVLSKAMEQDSNLIWPLRGWRRVDQLSERIGNETGWPPEPQTIRAYMSRVHRCIRKAARGKFPGMAIPELFERRRGLGARLTVPQIQVLDGRSMPRP